MIRYLGLIYDGSMRFKNGAIQSTNVLKRMAREIRNELRKDPNFKTNSGISRLLA